MNSALSFTLCSATLFLTFSVCAKDLGRIGATFPIGEVDMLLWIEQRLQGFERSGELDKMQQAFARRVRHRVNHPVPLALSTTSTPDSFLVDPSLILATDLTDAYGKIFAFAGTQINPFDIQTWPEKSRPAHPFEYAQVLVFFDGRDHKQLAFARNFTSTKPIKWILTGGSPNAVARALDQRIYFDQQGLLSKQVHLKAVPSVVEQSGTHWKVTEFDVTDEVPMP